MTTTPSKTTGVPPATMRGLQRSFRKVPTKTVVLTDWEHADSEEFWRRVAFAVAAGTTVEEIGAALGISNFVMRHNLYGK